MYKIVIKSTIVICSMLIVSCSYQAKDRNSDIYRGEIQFTDTLCQLGTFTFSPDSVYSNEFIFKNTGLVPVAILNVIPSCQCITARYTQGAIQPGKTGKVNVIFNGQKSSPGYFNKSVRVRINSDHIYTLRLIGIMNK